ncbi:MAG: 16S rRNA (guanine(527)-N(7))-methyltransferase RsmG [Candidatus Alcyoniella australis]|nr:16S rRNA (guanine(527)-N(7))-methyltransferase RsmG [Candidatus Alcyoniella australis]
MRQELIDLLARDAARYGLPQNTLELTADYVLELARWSAKINLTADREPRTIVQRHVLDSWTALPLLPQSGTLADLGSGGGLPGIPLALARPELNVTLVESRGKKTAFLEHVARKLGLTNVRVLTCRIEESSERFDLACARALAAPHSALELLRNVLPNGGKALLWTTTDDAPAIEAHWKLLQRLEYGLAPDPHPTRLILHLERINNLG